MTIAIYHIYYGEDWLWESITQMLKFMDKVVVYYFDKPWGCIEEVVCGEKSYPVPTPIDASHIIIQILKRQYGDRIEVVKGEDSENNPITGPSRLLQKTFDRYPECSVVAHALPDHVESDNFGETLKRFIDSDLRVASTRPIRMWKLPNYKLSPYDPSRLATVLYKRGSGIEPYNRKEAVAGNFLDAALTYDFGFTLSYRSMWWKYYLRRAQALLISDESPVDGWLTTIWDSWQPSETSRDYGWCNGERDLGGVVRVDLSELPEIVRARVV